MQPFFLLSLLLTFALAGPSSVALAQAGSSRHQAAPVKLDAPPRYKGGQEKLNALVKEHLVYPEEAQKQGKTGTVVVSFVVEEDGKLSDLRVLEGLGAACDEEALRVAALLTEWLPGKVKNKPVRTQVQLPFPFGVSTKLEVEKPKGSKVIFHE